MKIIQSNLKDSNHKCSHLTYQDAFYGGIKLAFLPCNSGLASNVLCLWDSQSASVEAALTRAHLYRKCSVTDSRLVFALSFARCVQLAGKNFGTWQCGQAGLSPTSLLLFFFLPVLFCWTACWCFRQYSINSEQDIIRNEHVFQEMREARWGNTSYLLWQHSF